VLNANIRVTPVVGPVVGENRAHRRRARGPAIGNVGEITGESVVDVRGEALRVAAFETQLRGVVFGCSVAV